MMVFVVAREGINSVLICGIFFDESAAMAHAEKCARGESDHYHDYTVRPYELDVAVDDIPDEHARFSWSDCLGKRHTSQNKDSAYLRLDRGDDDIGMRAV
jgi:hypothetical protein